MISAMPSSAAKRFRQRLLLVAGGNERLVEQILTLRTKIIDGRRAAFAQVGALSVDLQPAARPLLYVPGFSETIIGKSALAVALARRGRTVIVPKQDRSRLRRDPQNPRARRDATRAQAEYYLAVLAAAGVQRVDVFAHSYGCLVFAEMVRLASEHGLHYFDESSVVLLDPAGMVAGERLRRLAPAFARQTWWEFFSAKEFVDPTLVIFRAALACGFANPARTLREVGELCRTRLDVPAILAVAAQIRLVSYAHSRVYPAAFVRVGIEEMLASGAQVGGLSLLPDLRAPRTDRLESVRGRLEVTHNHEQFHPTQMAALIDNLLAN